MRAVFYDRFGGTEVLRIGDRPTPAPGPGQVRIDLTAASVIPADWKLRAGLLTGMFPVTFPKIPGRDGVGIVTELGPGADYVSLGQPVCVVAQHTEDGTHAQSIVRDRRTLAPLPDGLDHTRAAALMHAGVCAWICLVETAELQHGQRILIHGGAGAIGSLAVQLARHIGAHVTTTCRHDNIGFVRDMGADVALAYDREDFAATRVRYDVVLDLIGGAVHDRSYQVLAPGGHMVCLRAAPIRDRAAEHGVRLSIPDIHDLPCALRATVDLAAAGVFRPQVAAVLPMDQAAKAHRMLEAGEVSRGRVVLEIPAG